MINLQPIYLHALKLYLYLTFRQMDYLQDHLSGQFSNYNWAATDHNCYAAKSCSSDFKKIEIFFPFFIQDYYFIRVILRLFDVCLWCNIATANCKVCGRENKEKTSRRDYCNSLLGFIKAAPMNLQRLKVIQDAAPCILTGTRTRDHISPISFFVLSPCNIKNRI